MRTVALFVVLALAGAWAHAGAVKVYNHSILQKIYPEQYKPPDKSLGPIKLIGVRNGIFAGQVVVVSAGPISGLGAMVTDLKGPGTIPARAVQVRYAVADGVAGRGQKGYFDSLEEVPPAAVQPSKGGRAIQPVWITVSVPRDARAGDYSGQMTIRAAGSDPVAVRLKLKVIDYTLPDPDKYHGHMDIVQSPESVAMAYNVKMWSPEHLALLGKTFALLRPLGVKTLYITTVRRTHFGNEHALLRWYRDKNGELSPNFDTVEKSLDVAVKHLGRIPGVIFYCWEPITSMGHAGGTGRSERINDLPVKYTPERN